MSYPRAFSHIGLSVPDLDAAVKFYSEVFGFYIIMPPTDIVEETETAIGIMCVDVFGDGYGSFRIAHMVTSDGIGIELFEFPNAEKPENNLEYCCFSFLPREMMVGAPRFCMNCSNDSLKLRWLRSSEIVLVA